MRSTVEPRLILHSMAAIASEIAAPSGTPIVKMSALSSERIYQSVSPAKISAKFLNQTHCGGEKRS